jgi:hypothetical protein
MTPPLNVVNDGYAFFATAICSLAMSLESSSTVIWTLPGWNTTHSVEPPY